MTLSALLERLHLVNDEDKNIAPAELTQLYSDTLQNALNMGIEGFIPTSDPWEKIAWEEFYGTIHPGQKVLELGSGLGSVGITFAYKGYPTVMIEKDPVLASASAESAVKYGRMLQAPAKVIEGSYYCSEYIADRKQGRYDHRVLMIEGEIASETRTRRKGKKWYLHVAASEDAYKKHGISFSDFDVIYAYLWPEQTPSVVDMFKRYAKKDAKLLMFGPQTHDIAHQLGLSKTSREGNVFVK